MAYPEKVLQFELSDSMSDIREGWSAAITRGLVAFFDNSALARAIGINSEELDRLNAEGGLVSIKPSGNGFWMVSTLKRDNEGTPMQQFRNEYLASAAALYNQDAVLGFSAEINPLIFMLNQLPPGIREEFRSQTISPEFSSANLPSEP